MWQEGQDYLSKVSVWSRRTENPFTDNWTKV